MIDMIYKTDTIHKIFLISDLIDTVATPPIDFEYVDGVGIMPYARDGWIDDLDVERIKWIDTYLATGKEVYIAEWGVQTFENSPKRTRNYGLVSNEISKGKMIQEFLDCIDDWNIYWAYCSLRDFPIENSD